MNTTTPQPNNDALKLKAFDDTVELNGYTYFCQKSHLWCIIRMPVGIKHLYPTLRHQKTRYQLLCFPDKEKLIRFIETTDTVPIILNLFTSDNHLAS